MRTKRLMCAGQVRERDSVSEQKRRACQKIREDQAADNDSDGEQEEEEKMDEDCSKQEKETEVQRITNETVRNEIDRQVQDEQCKNTGEDMEQRDQRSQDSQAEGTGTRLLFLMPMRTFLMQMRISMTAEKERRQEHRD